MACVKEWGGPGGEKCASTLDFASPYLDPQCVGGMSVSVLGTVAVAEVVWIRECPGGCSCRRAVVRQGSYAGFDG